MAEQSVPNYLSPSLIICSKFPINGSGLLEMVLDGSKLVCMDKSGTNTCSSTSSSSRTNTNSSFYISATPNNKLLSST